MLSGLSGYIKGVKKAIGNMGTAHQATPTLGRIRIGSRDIEEIKLISQGGYAYVFQVRDVQTGEIFALKKMICQSPERVQTAKNEINYLRSLPDHPNLLKVFDTHVDNKDGCYYVYVLLEFCADGSIFDLMAKYESSRLSEKQIIFIMREVCDGVKALHSMRPPIAHRDLKIENVLLNNKRFKLCDFGSCSTSVVDFAKVPQSQYHNYEEEYDKNTTLMYRPPEMCDPYQKLIVSEKVDVWMLGCILYTMCFYKHPFQEMSKLSIVNAAYTFPKDHNYAPKLIDIIRICLTPNPTTRPSIFDLCKIFDNYFELNNIKLNPDAQRIKEEQRKQEQEMAKFENNSSNLPKFNGDIPVHELMKLQQQLAHDEDSSPVHIQAKVKMSHKQASHGKLNSHKNPSDFDGFGDFSQKNQAPDLHQFHSSPGLGNNNKDWFNFDDKPNNANHQSTHQSSFAPNKATLNNQVNAQWQNFDFGGSSNQQPNNNNNNNNQWSSWNQNQNQQVKPTQMQQQQQQSKPQNLMNQIGMGGFNNNNNNANFGNNNMNNPQMQMQKQMQMQGWNNQGGWNNQTMNNNNRMQMGWNQNMQNMQNNNMMNNMNRMQNFNTNNGWNNNNNFNANQNMVGGGFQNNSMQSNNQNAATVTNNLLDLADTKPVRLDTASGIMSLYGKK